MAVHPGDLEAKSTPQLVLLTFDDSINDINHELYKEMFETGRKNPNGCPISATFYVSHEWTDYRQVQNLWADGHEIASHSIRPGELKLVSLIRCVLRPHPLPNL
ncbi:hypothetical protein FJT64_004819 [Amphibalanus amphitrite]|uniref:NodB homology domain-containing protein n=1 Tax=Amphibalanus amphitrite TaxID=1232801 RepID=A0A6A4VY03_AMPAM|nr:hypothetical protein FJT64_004819 [Amphibalanus amphitrite]